MIKIEYDVFVCVLFMFEKGRMLRYSFDRIGVIEISFGGLAVPAREQCDYFPGSW